MKTIKNITHLVLLALFIVSCEGIEKEVINPDDIILLTILDEDGNEISQNIIGDGHTLITLKAEIPYNADIGFRSITFNKSGGEFVGIDGSTNVVVVDSKGIATTVLKVPLDSSNLFLSAEVKNEDQIFRDEKMLDLIDVGQVLDFQLLNEQSEPITQPVRADRNTILVLKVKVNYNQETLKKIKFKKSIGSLLSVVGDEDEAIKTIDEDSIAIINYRVPNTVEKVFFSAEVDAYESIFKELDIDLERAYADRIIIEPQLIVMDSTSQNTITTYLQRNIGVVSQETSAQFDAFQLDSNNQEKPVGRFTGLANAKTNENGVINNVIFKTDTGNINFDKPILIRVATLNDTGDVINETVMIN